MTQSELTKWNDRHFKICMALLARPSYNMHGDAAPSLRQIISKADRMVELLQEREQRMKSTASGTLEVSK